MIENLVLKVQYVSTLKKNVRVHRKLAQLGSKTVSEYISILTEIPDEEGLRASMTHEDGGNDSGESAA